MEFLLVLLVLFILFIVLPGLLIAALVILIHKPTREKVRGMFGVQKVDGQIVKVNKPVVDNDRDDITKDFVDFMNESVKHNKNYVFTKIEKSGKGAVEAEIKLLPLFDYDQEIQMDKEERNNYLQVIVDSGYIDKISAVDETNPFAVKKVIDELNADLNKAFVREAWDSSTLLLQNVFQLFKNDYTGDHSVEGIGVMVGVKNAEIVPLDKFSELKDVITMLDVDE